MLQVYNGKVSNVVAFGCFVQLDGLAKRWEGLVHISQLRKEGRVTEASEVVQRGQKVKARKEINTKLMAFLIEFWNCRSRFLPSRVRKFLYQWKKLTRKPAWIWTPRLSGSLAKKGKYINSQTSQYA